MDLSPFLDYVHIVMDDMVSGNSPGKVGDQNDVTHARRVRTLFCLTLRRMVGRHLCRRQV